jgi:predicted metal-dependent enzyme (double-stranded beta helix superfamily)
MTMTATDTTQAAPPTGERGPVPPALKRFIWDIQSMVELADSEREILLIGRDLMSRLVASDDCLPAVFAAAAPARGRQFQLYSDGEQRFTVVASVLAGGAGLALEQPGVWEITGVLRGAVARRLPAGAEEARALETGAAEARLSKTGATTAFANALAEQVSIALHVYGGPIGGMIRRSVSPDGAIGEGEAYANDEATPPYDIYTIQTEIKD